MNKALDYVSIKSEIGNYTNFITKPIALIYSCQKMKEIILVNSSIFFLKEYKDKILKPYNGLQEVTNDWQLIWYLRLGFH
jgi:hypothetical protein